MGKILGAVVAPHPPILLEEIGRGEEKKAVKTLEGLERVGEYVKDKGPDTIILITPHGPLFRDAVSISMEKTLKGDFANFGQEAVKLEYENDLDLAEAIVHRAFESGIMVAEVDKDFSRIYEVEADLDHGALVPLYFVDKKYRNFKLIHITYGLLAARDLYRFGQAINQAIDVSKRQLMIIASGDLSHKLSKEGPYAYSEKGEEFDRTIVEIIQEGRMEDLITFDLGLAEEAGECGLRSFMIMAGILGNYSLETEVFSYEAPFGVGYCTGKIDLEGKRDDSKMDLLEIIDERERKKLSALRKKESPIVTLARESLEHYIRTGKVLDIGNRIPEELVKERKPVFVSLKKDGLLRGCIGTTEATRENTGLEVIHNAIAAGSQDPRFDRVEEEELDSHIYSVDILEPAQPIESRDDLDVERYGLIVSKGSRRGLLLPRLEGIDTVEEQINIALDKAGISPYDDYSMERFQVIRYN